MASSASGQTAVYLSDGPAAHRPSTAENKRPCYLPCTEPPSARPSHSGHRGAAHRCAPRAATGSSERWYSQPCGTQSPIALIEQSHLGGLRFHVSNRSTPVLPLPIRPDLFGLGL